jgi:hypothetical protein
VTESTNPGRAAAREQLRAAVDSLEAIAAVGPVNTFSARALVRATLLLEEHDLAQRAVAILCQIPDRAFYAGLITNMELPNDFAERMKQVPTRDELERQHPVYGRDAKLAAIYQSAESSPHIRLCLEGSYEDAEAVAGNGVKLEEVGDTLAVLGEFDRAYALATGPKMEEFRRSGVLFVLVIELFLAGDLTWSRELLAKFEATGMDEGSRVHLALGFAGREPWRVYPYPDW